MEKKWFTSPVEGAYFIPFIVISTDRYGYETGFLNTEVRVYSLSEEELSVLKEIARVFGIRKCGWSVPHLISSDKRITKEVFDYPKGQFDTFEL